MICYVMHGREKMKFKFYVLNYDFNGKRVENFNIFNNILLNKETEKIVKKYLRSPKNFKYNDYFNKQVLFGFEGFCKELERLIMWQEWGRREYEISVGDAFEDDLEEYEKWDCYMQCKPNIEIIAREVIWQYKQYLKEKRK